MKYPIKTERASIDLLSENDYEDIINMYQLPESFQFIPKFRARPKKYFINFLDEKMRLNKNSIQRFLVTRAHQNNQFIGTLNLSYFQKTTLLQIGGVLSKKYWGKGYAYELGKELVRYAQSRSIKKIYGICEHENYAAQNVLKKLNFNLEKQEILEGKQLLFYEYTNELVIKCLKKS